MFSRFATAALRTGARAGRVSARTFATTSARPLFSSASSRLATGATVAGVVGFGAWSISQPVHLEGARTIAGEKGTVTERTFVMIKPDGVSRQIVGKIISRFEERGYKLVGVKSLVPSEALAKEHYADLASRSFYPGLVKYITSGTPVVALVWEGKDVIRQGRRMVGATNPLESDPGSIRGQFAVSVGRNIIHASDSHESATKEIGLWFGEKELAEYEPIAWPWVMADN